MTMQINNIPYRTIWPSADNAAVEIIDQARLPHVFATLRLNTMRDAERAIRDMQVRGAPHGGESALGYKVFALCEFEGD